MEEQNKTTDPEKQFPKIDGWWIAAIILIVLGLKGCSSMEVTVEPYDYSASPVAVTEA